MDRIGWLDFLFRSNFFANRTPRFGRSFVTGWLYFGIGMNMAVSLSGCGPGMVPAQVKNFPAKNENTAPMGPSAMIPRFQKSVSPDQRASSDGDSLESRQLGTEINSKPATGDMKLPASGIEVRIEEEKPRGTSNSRRGKKTFVRVCNNRDKGQYAFGVAPDGCDANDYGDISLIQNQYGPLMFDRQKDEEAERSRYVTQMHALIRDLVSAYLRRREPKISDKRIAIFTHAVLALGTQESYLSHYRIGLDGREKLLTGDRQISHGLMQINQRYHGARGDDNSFDLIGNLLYGIDLYYRSFQNVQSASCVKKAKSEKLTAAFRSAYSVYNGGREVVCRWQSSKAKWAKNDRGFFDHWKRAEWKKYVTDPQAPSPIRAKCVLNDDALCAFDESTSARQQGRPLKFADGLTCLLTAADTYTCTKDARTFQCLAALQNASFSGTPLELRSRDTGKKVRVLKDRDGVCRKFIPGLESFGVGGFVRIQKDTQLRKKIAGPVVAGIKAGQVLQVLDYEIRSREGRLEYHIRVRLDQKKEGYIFAGSSLDQLEWVKPVSGSDPKTRVDIPVAGATVRIVRKQGIMLREAGDGKSKVLVRIRSNESVSVEGVEVRGSDNQIYLKVRWKGYAGYIYAGHTYPMLTVGYWVHTETTP